MTMPEKVHSYVGRLATFTEAHHPAKRRASSSKKRAAGTVTWPHETPTPEELARAGFFYKPTTDSADNTQCFLCAVKLDGWDATDDALDEHLAHSSHCGWATSLTVNDENESRDPMTQSLVEARKSTFADFWPHEGKKGWKCKVGKMVEAGWCYDPAPEVEDGVTCFYCQLSLDGWEPKDNPLEEHRRRSPECLFFVLCERYAANNKPAGGKKGRASRGSEASRLSTQSNISASHETPSLARLDEDDDATAAGVDDSVLTTATTTSATVKGKKTGAKARAASKSKKKSAREQSVEPSVQYADIGESTHQATQEDTPTYPGSFPDSPEVEIAPRPKRATRRNTKQEDSSHVDDASTLELPKKAARGKRGKTQVSANFNPEPPTVPEPCMSEDASQLQSELEIAASFTDKEPTPPRPKRGTKRTSAGLAKAEASSVLVLEDVPFPSGPDTEAHAAQDNRGRKTVQQAGNGSERNAMMSEAPLAAEDAPLPKAAPKSKKGTKKTKPVQVLQDPESTPEPEPAVIEEPAMPINASTSPSPRPTPKAQTPAAEEFEPSPTPQKWSQARLSQTRPHCQPENTISRESLRSIHGQDTPDLSPRSSHASSDAENQPPSSAAVPSTVVKASLAGVQLPAPTTVQQHGQSTLISSPTKTIRVPLAAASTPHLSPSKHAQQIGSLTSTNPWTTVDLETVFLASPDKQESSSPSSSSPARALPARLAELSGALTSAEMGMTVEQWILWQATKGEERLRRECEWRVGVFEGEGGRAMRALEGVEVGM
ncbi:hypothetical protein LTR50_001734 [Elasticomyces elasticus]|nr:hypothetical protein LTR50_001734 [Elasticomyces elasticus]